MPLLFFSKVVIILMYWATENRKKKKITKIVGNTIFKKLLFICLMSYIAHQCFVWTTWTIYFSIYLSISPLGSHIPISIKKKHCENREKLHREHLIGCQGVKWFLLKYVTIITVTTATVTTATVTTVTVTTVTNWVFWVFVKIWFSLVLSQFEFFWVLSHFDFLSFVTIWVLEFGHNLRVWVLSQFELLSLSRSGFF